MLDFYNLVVVGSVKESEVMEERQGKGRQGRMQERRQAKGGIIGIIRSICIKESNVYDK